MTDAIDTAGTTDTMGGVATSGNSAQRSFLVGLIGSGVGPSLTPPMHEREAQQLGRRLIYRPIDITALGLAPASAVDLVHAAHQLGFDGLNITHPCKQLIVSALDDLSPEAAELAAVNTVVFDGDRAIGHNTDWSAFAQSLHRGLPDASLRRVVLLGAGGAGAAVAHALLMSGVRELVIVDVATDRASALAESARLRFPESRCVTGTPADLADVVSGADGLVHATPTGMADHPGLPVPAELLRPPLWVADIVYRPLDTELLRRAREHGCATLDGGGMAVFQASHAFALITGLDPDPERMLGHFAELLAAE